MKLPAHYRQQSAGRRSQAKAARSSAAIGLAVLVSLSFRNSITASQFLFQLRNSIVEAEVQDRPGIVAPSVPVPHQLTAEGAMQLRAILDVPELTSLHGAGLAKYASEAQEFYASFDYSLVWIHGRKPTVQARQIIEELQAAEDKGLRPEDYEAPLWNGRLAAFKLANPPSELDLVRFDVALTLSTMRFLSDLHLGRINPQALHFALDTPEKTFDLSNFVRQKLVNAQDPRVAVESVEPQFFGYRRTLQALQMYRELMRQDDGELLPNPYHVLKLGESYAGALRLERLLRLLEDLTGAQTKRTRMTYDSNLVEAVKHFQRRHGLKPDGFLDARTLQELNTPISRRVMQLQLTLERWRWLPSTFSRPPIVVNIPEFRLHIIDEEHHIVSSMNVVVGRAYHHETPVFESEIKSVIFRPFWNVPLEIQRDELAPQIETNPRYLSENSYEVVDAHENVVSQAELTKEMKDALQTGGLFLRQRPGPENSLGLIKFELPNPYDVYLHDTPAQDLFSRSRRDFSHGCVRVEDPLALAVWVLRDNPGWTAERIRSAMNGSETVRVSLDRPTRIWILYGTAIVLEDGQVRFLEDIYGHDAELERVLAQDNVDASP